MTNLTPEVPCVDCITLSICKARALQTDFKSATELMRLIHFLIGRCSTIEKYIYHMYIDIEKTAERQLDIFFEFDMVRVQMISRFLTNRKVYVE